MPKQKELPLPEPVEAFGDPWKPDEKNPATVPIPNAVIITNIEGPFTERDRKLWTFLVHAVWDDLASEQFHCFPVSKINKVFHELGGEKTASWVWESARRLSRTTVEWEEGPDEERLQGVSNLMNAIISKSKRQTGVLWFEIPKLLARVIKAPFRFSRIRLHFMIGLSGKYAVTLYEILESAVNRKSPCLEVELPQLRQWLKVPEGKLTKFYDLKRFALAPALKQINDNPQGAGFTATMEEIKKGRAVHSVRFSMVKTKLRLDLETRYKNKPKLLMGETDKPVSAVRLTSSAFEKAREAAPGYDIYYLEDEWREWMEKKGARPENPDAAFVAFCRKKAQKRPNP